MVTPPCKTGWSPTPPRGNGTERFLVFRASSMHFSTGLCSCRLGPASGSSTSGAAIDLCSCKTKIVADNDYLECPGELEYQEPTKALHSFFGERRVSSAGVRSLAVDGPPPVATLCCWFAETLCFPHLLMPLCHLRHSAAVLETPEDEVNTTAISSHDCFTCKGI